MDVEWVKIRSWHIVKLLSRGGLIGTYCGRWLPQQTQTVDQLPMDEKSCETCHRIALKDA